VLRFCCGKITKQLVPWENAAIIIVPANKSRNHGAGARAVWEIVQFHVFSGYKA
jgi:hypothetical protein